MMLLLNEEHANESCLPGRLDSGHRDEAGARGKLMGLLRCHSARTVRLTLQTINAPSNDLFEKVISY